MFLSRLLLLFLLSFIDISESVKCSQCFNYNGQVCVNSWDCIGNYCLFEEIVENTGIVTIKKSCLSQSFYVFDDGTFIRDTESCVSKRTNSKSYKVKVCNYANNCNNFCNDRPILPPLPNPIPIVNTLPPPILNGLFCYECTTDNGEDCMTGFCQGNYCLYERRLTGRKMFLRKSCIDDPQYLLDDGTLVNAIDVCEIRSTVDSTYYVKICQDVNNCNGYCNTANPDIEQRDPLVTCPVCESRNSNDCFSSETCKSNYCVYEYQRNSSSGAQYVRKGCSSSSFLIYPDNTRTKNINTCEYKTFGHVEYQIKICNSGNTCSIPCEVLPIDRDPPITCYTCTAYNQDDCTGSTCTGKYCVFDKQIIIKTGQSMVSKYCTNTASFPYPDKKVFTSAMGQCEYREVNGHSYAVKVCNTSYCNTLCSSNHYTSTHKPLPLTTKSSSISFNCVSLMTSFLIILIGFRLF